MGCVEAKIQEKKLIKQNIYNTSKYQANPEN
jgi:hypothetical protein